MRQATRNGRASLETHAHYWLGLLAAAMAEAIAHLRDDSPKVARAILKDALEDFLRSPVGDAGGKERLRRRAKD